MKRRGVVTGAGVVSSIGKSHGAFAQSLRAGVSGIGVMQERADVALPVRVAAELRDFRLDEQLRAVAALSPDLRSRALQAARRSPLTVQAAVAAAAEAYTMAGLAERPVPAERIGLIVAGSNLTQSYQFSLYPKVQRAPEYITPSYALHQFDTDTLGTVSEVLGIHGEGLTVGGASASGNVGIVKGYQLLQQGDVDVCLVVGALTDLSPLEFWAFHNAGALGGKTLGDRPDQACRPFDSAHEGFIYGQASGCLVLEALPSAEAREATILAELLGGAIVLDGNRSSDPREDGEARAMEQALRQAELEPAAVDYINAHGTSTPAGDITELKAIRRVFGDGTERIWLNSTKALTGHCLSAAGVVEAIAVLVQLQGGFVHPNRNLVNPVAEGFRFAPAAAVAEEITVAMSNSFGFGGINTSVLFKKGV